MRQPTNAAYVHMQEFEHLQKIRRKEEDEGPTLHDKNFKPSNPGKMGKVGVNTSFGGVIPYKEDDYTIPK